MTNLSSLFASIFFSIYAYSAAEFLPPLNTPEEFAQMRALIQKKLPWSAHNSDHYLKIQIAGLNYLRKRFPDYDKWAAEKPDPITISIERNEKTEKQLPVLLDDQLEATRKTLSHWSHEWFPHSNLDLESISNMRKIVIEKLKANLLNGPEAIRGLITGMIQILPPEERAAIFKLGVPELQIAALETKIRTKEQLDSSHFKFELLGLDRNQMTPEYLFAKMREKLNQSQNTFALLAMLKSLAKIESSDLNRSKSYALAELLPTLLSNEDFAFIDGSKDSFLASLQIELKQNDAKNDPLIKSLDNFVRSIPRHWFTSETKETLIRTPFLKVIEVHPYLGVYRGCVGGDCSTTMSPMFPYSPWEHVFYIQLNSGQFLGYVTLTRVEVEGRPAIYLKDLSGPKLSANMAEIVLNAFGKVFKYYGAERFLIATSDFTSNENHFDTLIEMFSEYNERGKKLQLRFLDLPVRTAIRENEQIFKSDAAYDSATRHLRGIEFVPKEAVLQGLSIRYNPGTLNPFVPDTPKATLLLALNLLKSDSKAKISDLPSIRPNEVRELFDLLQNPELLPIDQHYTNLAKEFAKFGIDLSRKFRQENDALFMRGHILAPDAFSHNDATLKNDSEKYLINFIRQHRDFKKSIDLVLRASQELNASPRMYELIALFKSRQDVRDILHLIAFADAGIASAQNSLSDPKIKERIAEAIVYYFENQEHLGSYRAEKNSAILQHSLYSLEWAIRNSSRMTMKTFESRWQESLEKLGLPKGEPLNPKLAERKALARSHCTDAFMGSSFEVNFRIILGLVQSQQYEKGLLLYRLYLAKDSIQNNPVLQKYIASLNAKGSEAELVELFLFAKMGFLQAQTQLKNSDSKNELLKFLVTWKSHDRLDEKTNELLGSIAKVGNDFETIFSFEKFWSTLMTNSSVNAQKNIDLTTLENLYSYFRKFIDPIDLTIDDIMKNDRLKMDLQVKHLSAKDAFSTKSELGKKMSLYFLYEYMKSGHSAESLFRQIVENISAYENKDYFHQFLTKLEQGLHSFECRKCAFNYIQAVQLKLIKNPRPLTKEILVEMKSRSHAVPIVYAIYQSHLLQMPLVPTSDNLEDIAEFLITKPDEVVPSLEPQLRNLAVEVLYLHPPKKRSSDRSKWVKTLIQVIQNENQIERKLKLSILAVQSGCTPELLEATFPGVFLDSTFASVALGSRPLVKQLLELKSSYLNYQVIPRCEALFKMTKTKR